MPKSDVRRRKQGKQPRASKADGDAQPKVNDGISICGVILRVLLCATLAVSGYLIYAYINSPTASIVISDFHDVKALKWAMVNNTDLQTGRRLFEDLEGPESIVVDDQGNWYTGLVDGRVVKIINGNTPASKVEDMTDNNGYTSGGKRDKRRPLGLRLAKNRLYLADAYQGIFVIDTVSKKWQKIVGFDDVTPPLCFTNDLVVTKDGKTIYFTDATSRWLYTETAYSHAEGECSGRVFKVDLKSKIVEKIRENLCFANGIQLNPEETRLLVSENARARVQVIDIASMTIVNTVYLPGGGDNIRPAKSGGYWVPIPALYDPAVELTYGYPFIRDIVTKMFRAEDLLKAFNLKQGIIVRLNKGFEPTSIHYDLTGKICRAITQVQEYEEGKFLLGSFIAHGIVHLENLGSK